MEVTLTRVRRLGLEPAERDGEVSLGSVGGAAMSVGRPEFLSESKLVRIPVRVSADGLTAQGVVELEPWGGWIPGFLRYVDELDRDWQGWTGAKEWSDDQHNVTLSATHDSTLVATVIVWLRRMPGWSGAGSWEVRVVVAVEPASLTSFARAIHEALSSAPWNADP